MSVKSDRPSRPGSCTWRKITSCSGPNSARQARMRRSSVRRMPAPSSGWRRRISSKIATGRRPGRRLQERHDLAIPNASQAGRAAAAPAAPSSARAGVGSFSRRYALAAAEPGLGRCDPHRRWSVDAHVEPHLAVGDMAAGQKSASSLHEKKPGLTWPTTTARRRLPLKNAPPRGRLLRSGYALPTQTTPAAILILIDAESHLDCRATPEIIAPTRMHVENRPNRPSGIVQYLYRVGSVRELARVREAADCPVGRIQSPDRTRR